MSHRISQGKIFYSLFKCGFLALVAMLSLLPVWLMITNSLKRSVEISVMPPKFLFRPVLTHYNKMFANDDFLSYFKNSVVVAAASTTGSVIFSLMAAYGFLITKSKWFGKITDLLLLSKMVMPITVLIPLYIILNAMGLIGSYFGPVVAHAAINIPFVIWLFLGFMRELPKELIEASRIDGCTRPAALWKILLPLLTPAVGAAIILAGQYSWNELLFSIQLTKVSTYTLTVAIAKYVGAVAVDWGKSSAAACVTMIPVIILGFAMQKYLVRGLTAGAVKG
ncbi:MAG: carbohydrate ABC transporter permease [Treponema sp.]|jgi:multiple sugar transport system permease protein|nr:carbohydrate ABC transporter permease [Treponema sp.]